MRGNLAGPFSGIGRLAPFAAGAGIDLRDSTDLILRRCQLPVIQTALRLLQWPLRADLMSLYQHAIRAINAAILCQGSPATINSHSSILLDVKSRVAGVAFTIIVSLAMPCGV
jgi:hypothetical protein